MPPAGPRHSVPAPSPALFALPLEAPKGPEVFSATFSVVPTTQARPGFPRLAGPHCALTVLRYATVLLSNAQRCPSILPPPLPSFLLPASAHLAGLEVAATAVRLADVPWPGEHAPCRHLAGDRFEGS